MRSAIQSTGAISSITLGSPAGDFSLPGTDGKTYSLSQFHGQPVLIEFMAPWCPHCREAQPLILATREFLQKQNIHTNIVVGMTKKPFLFYLVCCLLYLAMAVASSVVIDWLERRTGRGLTRAKA